MLDNFDNCELTESGISDFSIFLFLDGQKEIFNSSRVSSKLLLVASIVNLTIEDTCNPHIGTIQSPLKEL